MNVSARSLDTRKPTNPAMSVYVRNEAKSRSVALLVRAIVIVSVWLHNKVKWKTVHCRTMSQLMAFVNERIGVVSLNSRFFYISSSSVFFCALNHVHRVELMQKPFNFTLALRHQHSLATQTEATETAKETRAKKKRMKMNNKLRVVVKPMLNRNK